MDIPSSAECPSVYLASARYGACARQRFRFVCEVTALLLSAAFFPNCIIRERLWVHDLCKHFAYVRHQQPIDRYAHNLRCIQDRASLDERVNFLFLIRPKPNIHDFFTFDFPDLFRGRLFITSVIPCNAKSAGLSRSFRRFLAQ
jgi:hypothetical protein